MVKIGFNVTAPAPEPVSVTIYNAAGTTIARLFHRTPLPPGRYTALWDGRDLRGLTVRHGVYIATFRAGNRTAFRLFDWHPSTG